MSNGIYVGTDKNGTKVYHDYTCNKCGGQGGAEAWRFTGWTCYKCGGSGRQDKPEIYKVYTPEYKAKLDGQRAKREAKRQAEYEATMTATANEKNVEFLTKHFNNKDTVKVITGNTYPIKDELKAEGCKFQSGLGWYTTEDTSRPYVEVTVSSLIYAGDYGIYEFNNYAVIEAVVKEQINKTKVESNHQGEVGKRYTLQLICESCFGFEVPSFSGWGTSTMYINKFIDAIGNVFIWKSSSSVSTGEHTVVGTIKEHSEYQGVKQTVLTRCKIN